MKKITAIILSALMLLAFAACGEKDGGADTSDTAGTSANTAPIGTENADTESEITDTEKAEASETEAPETEAPETEAHEHKYELSESASATCTEDGKNTYICECGDTYTEAEPAKGHTYSVTSSSEMTCTEDGTTVYTCECGDTYTETVPAEGHAWEDWVITEEATAGRDGTSTRTCGICSEKETKTIEKLGYTTEYVRKIFYAVNSGNTMLDMGSNNSGIFSGDLASIAAENIPYFVMDYLRSWDESMIEEYCVYETFTNEYNTWTMMTECNLPLDFAEKYAEILLGHKYELSSMAKDGIIKIEMYGGFGGGEYYHGFGGFEDIGDDTLAITVNYNKIDYDAGTETVISSGILTVKLHESGLWAIKSYSAE